MCSELSSQQRDSLGQDSASQKHSHNCITWASSKTGPILPQHKLSHIQTMLYTLIYYMHIQTTACTYQHIQTIHPGETRHTGCRNSSVWSCFLERMVTVQKRYVEQKKLKKNINIKKYAIVDSWQTNAETASVFISPPQNKWYSFQALF